MWQVGALRRKPRSRGGVLRFRADSFPPRNKLGAPVTIGAPFSLTQFWPRRGLSPVLTRCKAAKAKVSPHGGTGKYRLEDDCNRSWDIALAAFPAAYGPSALDADEFSQPPGR